MPLPVPNLDDRRFQDYVDDAKRLVQQRCPAWTDHNVSDPGVTLIETFAYMVDQLTYRLNRVPDRNYVKFLELIGVTLFPPSAARADVTFWLSAPQEATVTVPRASRVATQRVQRAQGAVIFETLEDLPIVTSGLQRAMSVSSELEVRDHTDTLTLTGYQCFDPLPHPGDRLVLGLSAAVPSNIITLRFQCHVEGVGVDPLNPPLIWEAYDGHEWIACEQTQDDTGGLNQAGDIVLHVPAGHTEAVFEGRRCGWIQCRVTEPEPDQPFFSSSPYIDRLSVFTVGGTVAAVHGSDTDVEIIGISEGVGAQRFGLVNTPIVAGDAPVVLEVAGGGEGWEEWTQVETLAFSDEEDHHFLLDAATGELILGPAVRLEDGTVRQYGAVPPKGAPLRVRRYRSGGGKDGNVAAGALSVMKTNLPFVSTVENRFPAAGGVDGEDIENAKVRGPISFRTLGRAVTVEDYELLAKGAAPDVARVKCVPAGAVGEEAGVRVLLVPAVADDEDGTIPFERLDPTPELLQRVAAELDLRRTIGARVLVEPPLYQGITVVAEIRARSTADPVRLEDEAKALLYRYLHPIDGGPDGTGWPFGRPLHAGEIHAVLQGLYGVDRVEEVRLFPADPIDQVRGPATQRIEIAPNALFFSYGHEVRDVTR